MSIFLEDGGDHEVAVLLGITVEEFIDALRTVPAGATLTDHYGDLNLLLVFQAPSPANPITV